MEGERKRKEKGKENLPPLKFRSGYATRAVCLRVNQGGTNHKCYTQRLVILHGERPTDEL